MMPTLRDGELGSGPGAGIKRYRVTDLEGESIMHVGFAQSANMSVSVNNACGLCSVRHCVCICELCTSVGFVQVRHCVCGIDLP